MPLIRLKFTSFFTLNKLEIFCDVLGAGEERMLNVVFFIIGSPNNEPNH